MTAEAALELLRNGDPAGALGLLGETASPDERSIPRVMPRVAWYCSPTICRRRR